MEKRISSEGEGSFFEIQQELDLNCVHKTDDNV